jgi:hypothetical protein
MKTGKLVAITFIAGVALGGGTVSLVNWMQVDLPSYSSSAESDNDAGSSIDREEMQRLLARIGQQNAEINSLRSQLDDNEEVVQLDVEEPVEMTEEELIEQQRAERRARMDERMGRRMDDLVNTYGLSEAQRQLLEQVMEQRREYFRARRNGEDVEPYNFDAALQGIMDDEQFGRYLEDTQQEIYNRAEMMATAQSVRLKQVLDLPQEQQDQVFDAIHYTAQEAMIARQSGEEFDMRNAVNSRLSEILTTEQMQAYSESQDAGPGMGLGRGMGPGGGGGRPPGG